MNPMIIFIMVVLVLMNGIGYLGSPAQPGGNRPYWGGLGLVILVVLLLYLFGVIHA